MSAVELRLVDRSDRAALIKANTDSTTHHYPWVTPFTDEEGFEAYFAGLNARDKVGLIAREKSTGELVGVLNLSQIFRKGFQNAYLGYYGMPATSGRGLMTQAVRLTLGYAFGELGLHRIEANIQPDNLRSIAVVRRVGFRKEGFSPRYLQIGGVWCDHERWAILSDELTCP